MNNKTIIYLFCITLPIFLLLFSFKTTIYFSELTPAQEGWMDYFDDESEMPENYTLNGISHMQDVKKVMKNIEYLFYFLLLIITLMITYFYNSKKMSSNNEFKQLLRYGGITTISFIGLLLIIGITSFNYLFSAFHKIFFPQGNWQFPADSLLIQTFPESFFFGITISIMIQTLIWGMIFILLSFYLKNDSQSKRS